MGGIPRPNIRWVESPNFGYPPGARGRHGYSVVAFVEHITQGYQPGVDSWFQNPASGASTQFTVNVDGTIHQYVRLEDAAWGNGLMNRPDMSVPWLADCWNRNINPNLLTVSIEHEGRHSTYPADHPRAGQIKAPDWEPTEPQYQASVHLNAWLHQEFGLTPSRETVLGHFQIDAINRPYCPGPKFPFARMLADMGAQIWALPKVKIILPGGAAIWGELIGGTTWAPARALAEGIGVPVDWVPDPPTAIIGRTPAAFGKPGDWAWPTVRVVATSLDNSRQIAAWGMAREGSTWAPARAVCEASGYKVRWQPQPPAVYIEQVSGAPAPANDVAVRKGISPI